MIDAIRMQMEVQRRLHEQLEVRRVHLSTILPLYISLQNCFGGKHKDKFFFVFYGQLVCVVLV